ncbi:DUF928 domain-containing protein [Mucilaginibacter sp. PPCGB 2223]|uniref:DUF928 domain-containing protein n=1 Tax=Mucilaginibacter sp. PPCGB 2223 TaxID=1886027 RepID=UPI000825263F|nr:DUF928 domain-containing protein [Mucilaginibacter sp. PPCGB 2223]OCX53369.1 DUF928 domain-containing protein [Mucilaginibacter sp. PPCGB 2223]
MLKRYIVVILLLFSLPALGQTTIQFIPELYGRNVDGLFRCAIISTGGRQSVTLSVVVKERKAGTVCIINTTAFNIATGNNVLPFTIAHNSSVQFANTSTGRLVSVNHNFPEGDYEYCFTVNYVNHEYLPVEQCFDYTLAPFAELNLIDPYDQDKICDQRPLLTWQPLIPGVPGAMYQLVLAEIKSGQNPTEALNYNLPVINQSNILSPVLPYPSIAPQLEKGKTYAWQVTAYKDQTVLNRTAVWSFKVECQDSTKKISDDGYRDIEDLAKGNYYIAAGVLKFAVVNPYQSQDLKYEISSLDKPDKKVKHLPKLKLQSGDNKINIDLSENNAFNDNAYYILKVRLPNGVVNSLRFIYIEPK